MNGEPTVSGLFPDASGHMPRAKGGRRVDTRAERGADEQPKVAPSPKTPKQTVRGKRLRVSFSEEDQVHKFSVLQGDLDERREHWHQILDAAALYNSDEDDAFDESDDEETLDSASCAFAAATGTASMKADPEPLNSGPQRRSSVAAGINDDEAPRYAI